MATIKQQKSVPFTPSQMYQLVDQIEYYPDFLPWCIRSEILHRDTDECRATLVIGASGIEKSFTTLNRLQHDRMIEIRLENGPFKHLEGFWRFEEDQDGGCIVSLDLDFELSGGLLNFAFEPIFMQVASTFVDAFSQRAEALYGTPVAS